MPAITPRIASLAAVAGGAVFACMGAIQATQGLGGTQGGTHNTIDSTGEYLVTGGLAAALVLTVPAYRLLGGLAGRPRAAWAAIAPQLVLAVMCVISVIRGEDPAFFNAVAPVCLLTWLGASVALTRGLRRTGAVPAAVAFALPALMFATFGLSIIGGALATGAFWIAFGSGLARGTLGRPVAKPLAA